MTTKRWIDETSGASELERAVLRSGLDVEPPADSEQAVWRSLGPVLGAPLVPNGAGSPVAPSTAGAAHAPGVTSALSVTSASTFVTLGKGFALGVGVSLAVAGVGRLESVPARETSSGVNRAPASERREGAPVAVNPQPGLPELAASSRVEPAPSAAKSVAAPARPSAPPGVSAALPSSTEARPAETPAVAVFPVAPERSALRASELEQEAALLRRARAELRAGRLAEAFATLEASREKFSFPELAQEREALLVELLYRSGQRANAIEKARSFLRRYPESPHAAKLRSIASSEER
jgi:hypothetical protein